MALTSASKLGCGTGNRDAGTDDLKYKLIEMYSDVFDEHRLKPITGPPMKINQVEGAVPCKKHKPYNYREKVKTKLEEMVEGDN